MKSLFSASLPVIAIAAVVVALVALAFLANRGPGPDIDPNPLACSSVEKGFEYSAAGVSHTVVDVIPDKGLALVSTPGKVGSDLVQCSQIPVATR